MANSNSPKSKAARAESAKKTISTKLASGEYAQFNVFGNADDVLYIKETLQKIGGTRVQALKTLCDMYHK